jgi:hypothetical protein
VAAVARADAHRRMKNDEVIAHYAPAGNRSPDVIQIAQLAERVVVSTPMTVHPTRRTPPLGSWIARQTPPRPLRYRNDVSIDGHLASRQRTSVIEPNSGFGMLSEVLVHRISRAFPMHLVGQLSNPSAALGAVFKALPDEPIKATARPEPQFDVGRLGTSVVQRAVVKVLASARHPLTVLEAQAAVADLLGRPVSKGSINCCLSTGALGDKPRFERVARGCYRLRHDGCAR